MTHHIADNYHALPLVEYARGACEAVLTEEESVSHLMLFSSTSYHRGGLYLRFQKIPSHVKDVVDYAKNHKETDYLKTIDLSEDIEDQLRDIDEVYEKVNNHKFQSASPRW